MVLFFILIFSQIVFAMDAMPSEKFFHNEKNEILAWVFFADKGPQELLPLQKAAGLLSERAVQRRLKLGRKSLIDYSDKRIYEPYLEKIKPLVSKIRVQSKWLNAVSVEMPPQMLNNLQAMDFVEKVKPVMRYRRDLPPEKEQAMQPSKMQAAKIEKSSGLNYGASWDQVSMINANALHENGIRGEGVLICLLDDGFNLLYHHISLDSLDLLATWDFIHNDESVDDSEFEASEGWHGTMTLSTIGGNTPGQLIGTAFKAGYILGKTEVDATETPVEEDYWVAGLQWADSMGADLVSSSLGYLDWDPGYESFNYTWEDMDGNTAVTTIAADLAVEKGMLIFNSAGNMGSNAEHNTLIAPSDGDNVMAVAAVDKNWSRASFSSVGLSADGRIKPDIAAMGASAYTAYARTYGSIDSTSFVYASGTSFSCPIAAGGAALLLSAHPDLTPAEVQEALRQTATQSDSPDRYLGWGIIDVEAALNYIETVSIVYHQNGYLPDNVYLFQNYPNPFNASTTIQYLLRQASMVELQVFDMNGREVFSSGPELRKGGGMVSETVNMNNQASGVYIYRIKAKDLKDGIVTSRSSKMILIK